MGTIKIFWKKKKKEREKREKREKESTINGKETERSPGVGGLLLLKRFAVASSEMARSPIVTSSTFHRRAYNFEKTKCHNDQGRTI